MAFSTGASIVVKCLCECGHKWRCELSREEEAKALKVAKPLAYAERLVQEGEECPACGWPGNIRKPQG